MIKEEKIEFMSKWCKYSKYKIEKNNNILYVLPDENAVPITYDPFEIKNDILKDLMIIGEMVNGDETIKFTNTNLTYEAKSKTKEFQKVVLDFVSKYGLLGNFRYFPKNFDFLEKDNEISYSSKLDSSLSIIDFEQRYFWPDKKIDWSKKMTVNDLHRNSGLDANLIQVEGDRLNDFIFSKNYAEPISEIIDFAESVYVTKGVIGTYLYGNLEPDLKEFYAETILNQEVYKINFKYGIENGKIKFQWNFHSLRAAINAMLLLNETNGRTEVRLCKYCGKPFIAENLKAEYDTTTCRNKANIANTRKRKNK